MIRRPGPPVCALEVGALADRRLCQITLQRKSACGNRKSDLHPSAPCRGPPRRPAWRARRSGRRPGRHEPRLRAGGDSRPSRSRCSCRSRPAAPPTRWRAQLAVPAGQGAGPAGDRREPARRRPARMAAGLARAVAATRDGYTVAIAPATLFRVPHHAEGALRPDEGPDLHHGLLGLHLRAGGARSRRRGRRSQEFIAYAKANPGKVSVGASGCRQHRPRRDHLAGAEDRAPT